ncbi:Bifunctional DNA primase/polymerase, N-terminal [Micromonospora pallida]|uniref:Bifunctional DNA primase/polymerase, N-terminal n=1 Tax=Micromonospora pallida TaxID=145854 RepID=A0A1C6RKP4_9ACTN|nr:bifunctional DNA primase/polymerase [Micromonospora pallida]SCL17606.1 Bifunctional DNA primase/polymerase, N-terminal [Micromonospora pallida]
MWGTVGPRVVHLSPLERVRLRRIAVRYALHGWEVTPGACLARSRFVCGRAGCPTVGCHPALENWDLAASADPARVATWWRSRPHGVLLPTGRAFDVLEVPSYLGQHVLDGISTHPADRARGPVAVTPTGRWMFLVRPGDPLRPELDHCFHVVRHGVGSWIPAPPTRLPEGPVRWAFAPEQARWRLPDSYLVQRAMVDTLRASGVALTADLLPGQLPLPRRGF